MYLGDFLYTFFCRAYFGTQWEKYLESRSITDGKSDPVFPDHYGFKERDAFVKSVSYSGWGGSSGHDAPMIASVPNQLTLFKKIQMNTCLPFYVSKY